jgi:hypothetical protein
LFLERTRGYASKRIVYFVSTQTIRNVIDTMTHCSIFAPISQTKFAQPDWKTLNQSTTTNHVTFSEMVAHRLFIPRPVQDTSG